VIWRAGFQAVARGACAVLTCGEPGASLYERGGMPDDFRPGLSDIDLALVLPGDPARPAPPERASRGAGNGSAG
jgi:hypothetical protein